MLAAGEASATIDAMEGQVASTWYATARAAGVSARPCDRIAPAFAYPGFLGRKTGKEGVIQPWIRQR